MSQEPILAESPARNTLYVCRGLSRGGGVYIYIYTHTYIYICMYIYIYNLGNDPWRNAMLEP